MTYLEAEMGEVGGVPEAAPLVDEDESLGRVDGAVKHRVDHALHGALVLVVLSGFPQQDLSRCKQCKKRAVGLIL